MRSNKDIFEFSRGYKAGEEEAKAKNAALVQERDRLRDALTYIYHLKSGSHLGRPRSSDVTCVFCMSYLAVHDGAYGESIDYKNLLETLQEQRKESQS